MGGSGCQESRYGSFDLRHPCGDLEWRVRGGLQEDVGEVLAYEVKRGLPWPSSGSDSALPLQGARVRSLVGELRSHMLCSMAKKKIKCQETG